MDDVCSFIEAPAPYLLGALSGKRCVQFNAGCFRFEFRSRHQNDAAVPAAQIEHPFAGFQSANFQHLLNNGRRRRVIRR